MNTEIVNVFAKWQVKEGNVETVLALLKRVVQQSKAEAGNIHYNVFQDQNDSNTLILAETYKDDEALHYHRNTAHFQNIVVEQIVPLLQGREVVLSKQLTF